MKIFGQHIKGPNIEVLVIPRQDFDIIVKAQSVLDDSIFDSMVPMPKAPAVMKPGQAPSTDDKDPNYLKSIQRLSQLRTAWTIVESLKPTEAFEWETVKAEDPNSWGNWRKELEEAFFTPSEISRIVDLVLKANGLHEGRLEEARQRFLAGNARPFIPASSPMEEQLSTPFGDAVNDSAYVPPV